MPLPAVLQPGKQRPREGSDLSKTSQRKGRALPSQRGTTHQHMLCVWIPEGKEPTSVLFVFFFIQTPTTKEFGVVSLIHSENFLQDSVLTAHPPAG